MWDKKPEYKYAYIVEINEHGDLIFYDKLMKIILAVASGQWISMFVDDDQKTQPDLTGMAK